MAYNQLVIFLVDVGSHLHLKLEAGSSQHDPLMFVSQKVSQYLLVPKFGAPG